MKKKDKIGKMIEKIILTSYMHYKLKKKGINFKMGNRNNKIQTKEDLITLSTQEKVSTDRNQMQEQIIINYLNKMPNPFITLTVEQISKDLHIGINQAYDLFKQKDFPTINIGKRKVVSLAAYLLWKMSKKGVV